MTAPTSTKRRTLAGLMSGRQPLLAAWTLSGDNPTAAAKARGITRTTLGSLSADLLEDVLKVVSETVTNAARHTLSGQPGGVLGLAFAVKNDELTVVVADQGRLDDLAPQISPPDRVDDDGLFEGGMGLKVCDCLGSLLIEGDRHGRRISVRFPLPPTAKERTP